MSTAVEAMLDDQAPARGGEMGARIRAFDWAATPLGPMDRWPHSLRITVDLMLESVYPGWIGWGADYIQFYNDAARPVFGSKFETALGQPGAQSWGEIWAHIGKVFDSALVEGRSTYIVDDPSAYDRHGFIEETYAISGTNPIRDEAGRACGVYVTFVETTERVIAHRRLRTLRDLGAAAALPAGSRADACTAAARILEGNDLDLPFALLYLLDGTDGVARLSGRCGLPPGHPAAPEQVPLGGARRSAWPLEEVAARGIATLVDDVDRRFGPLECGPWPERPRLAMVLPLADSRRERPAGLLVAGISARRPFDADYQDFLQMVAGHVATGVRNAEIREEERLRLEALAQLDRAKSLFFSDVSHEFRTPLALILGPMEQLEAELGSAITPAARELIAIANRNGLRLRQLVDTVLDFARIEAGHGEAAAVPTDLAALTAELAGMFRSAAEAAGLALRVECSPLPWPVSVDPEMWEKIVLNLLSNALKFTFQGEIAVTLRPAADRVELTVRDTGVGIPAEELPRLFERFHRVRGGRARSHEGSGIGLALVRELVLLHGGQLRVESTPDVGTTFTASLPAGGTGAPPAEASTPRTAGAATRAELARWARKAADAPPHAPPAAPRVLVVDDNADMRTYVARLLAPVYRVEVCADGAAALESVRRSRPELVISDVMMPGLDGVELVRALRADPATAALPIVLLSARAGVDEALEGFGAGADDYVVKPFSARELLARVDAQLARAALREHLAAAEERSRIARDLHDSVTQTLIAATLQAEGLAAPSAVAPDPRAGEIAGLARMTRGALAEMRVLLAEMRPELLERTRLGHMIEQLAAAVQGRMHLAVSARVEDAGSERLPPEVRVAVYRIAQESLNNAARHARAPTAEVVLAATGVSVDLTVRDAGAGFDPEAVPAGMGLVGMRERAAAVHAELKIDTRAGEGTEVSLRWRAAEA